MKWTDASSLSRECEKGVAAMVSDVNFQYRNNSLLNQCYMQYQNSVAQDPSSSTLCRQSEYEEFCISQISGQVCIVSTGFVDISFCVPRECSSWPAGLLPLFFNPVSSSINCDLPQDESLLFPALTSTIVILFGSFLVIFAISTPKQVLSNS